jgi:hypothetical protein
MNLPRLILQAIVPGPAHPGPGLLQSNLGGCPWRVTVASILLCRTRRNQAEPALWEILRRWPTAGHLARAEGLEDVIRPCGLHRNRARQLTRFSGLWLGGSWDDLRELPGVGLYVSDAVGLVCLGCTDIASGDRALLEHAKTLTRQAEVHHS